MADDRVRDAFTPEEVALLETVAAQIGVVIANSRIYSRMKERDRLAALGSMAAGLAHEVKNPLGAIKGAAQLLEESTRRRRAPTASRASREFVGIILEEVNRLDRVVGSFLDYARPHAGNPIPLDMNAAVRRTVQILSTQTSEASTCSSTLTEPLPRVEIDPGEVSPGADQPDAERHPGDGRRGEDHREHVAPADTRGVDGRRRIPRRASRAGDEPGEVVEVTVRDTGPGIAQKVLRNLFIPFFTTKERGTGLGLAISQSIVQNAGGTIDVQTQSGAGRPSPSSCPPPPTR